MYELVSRQYIIEGKIPVEDWALAMRFLGGLGIVATEPTDLNTLTSVLAVEPETLSPGTIPYTLEEITLAEQYLGNEHLGEFWPQYRNNSPKPVSKNITLSWGLNLLAHPSPKGSRFRLTSEQSASYAVTLGLKAVAPRSKVGFSDEYGPDVYGLWANHNYGDTVIEVGSFIRSVRRINKMPTQKRPTGVDAATLRFFNAIADKLEDQISAPSEPLD